MRWESLKVVLAVLLLRLVGKTLRIRTEGTDSMSGVRADGRPVLYAFFHGSLFPLVYAHRDQGVCILTSLSRDGELLSRVLMKTGYRVVRGSSTRGGIKGLLEMTRVVAKGHDGGIAVDGPKGPRWKAKPGVLLLAQKTGSPIIPIGVGFGKAKRFDRSWDAFQFPYPFSRVVLRYGEPIWIEGDLTGRERDVEERLIRLTDEAAQRAQAG